MSLKAIMIKARRAVTDDHLAKALDAFDEMEREIEKLGRALTLAHTIVNYTIINREDLKDAAESLRAYRT